MVGWQRLGRANLVWSVTARTTRLGRLADKVAAGNRPKSPGFSRPRKAPPRSAKGGGRAGVPRFRRPGLRVPYPVAADQWAAGFPAGAQSPRQPGRRGEGPAAASERIDLSI